MKNKKIILLFLVLLIIIFVVGFFSIKFVNPNAECKVTPLIFKAAIPVGAVYKVFFFVFLLKNFNK